MKVKKLKYFIEKKKRFTALRAFSTHNAATGKL
jgi:hypothetical protein